MNVLVISRAEEDHQFFRRTLGNRRWKIRSVRSALEAWKALHTACVGAVVVDCDMGDGPGWREVLGEVEDMGGYPPVIMMSRLADNRQWAEVLNLGGYDLLMKPLDVAEVARVLAMATRQSLAVEAAAVTA